MIIRTNLKIRSGAASYVNFAAMGRFGEQSKFRKIGGKKRFTIISQIIYFNGSKGKVSFSKQLRDKIFFWTYICRIKL